MDFVTKVLAVLFGYVTLFYEVRGFHNDPKCGQTYYRNPKIIGGENVREAEFPWFVSIKETGRYECGGFIVNEKIVITAAHCFKHFSERVADAPKTISVTLAVHYMNHKRAKFSSKFSLWELEVKVKRIIRHPQYDASSNSGKYDIALLLLEDKIEWNHGTRPVCLPTTSHIDLSRKVPNTPNAKNYTEVSDYENGEIAIVAGWASGEAGGTNSILQKINLKLYNNEDCAQILKEKNVSIGTGIDSSIICAASIDLGVDSCTGDSGSALMVKRGKVWIAIGIVSSGLGICGNGVPGLYTRISSYMDWIDLHNDQINSSIFFEKFTSFVPHKL